MITVNDIRDYGNKSISENIYEDYPDDEGYLFVKGFGSGK